MILVRSCRPLLLLQLLITVSQYHFTEGSAYSAATSNANDNNIRKLQQHHPVYCRPADLPPHQTSTWQDEFPFNLDNLPVGLCEGMVTIREDGHMCVMGKVNYDQLQAISGFNRPIYQLTAGEVSINGHMIGGSGYVWLGPEVFYLYDFISSYTVNGVEYPADSSINDRLLAASRGSIDGVCLKPEFRTEEQFYSISHKTTITSKTMPLDIKTVKKASYTFVSKAFTVYEFHEWTWPSGGGIFELGKLTYSVSNFLTNLFNVVSAPNIASGGGGVFALIPTNIFAPLARLLVFGTVSTTKFPVPVSAPDDITEAIQIDTEFRTLVKALEDGLFTKKSIPLYYYVRFKKVEPFENSVSCWNETAVILEITGPQGDGAGLDAWVDDVVTPALLEAGGTIGLHFGKRIPPHSRTTQEALEKYASCGVQLNLDISQSDCYHPQCTRTTSPQPFTYPPQYYTFDA